jgi:uncharacterized protein
MARQSTHSDRPSGTSKRGFASMDPERQRAIASKGGKAAHEQGKAHEFDSREAAEAGRKGGEAVSQNREHMAEIGARGGRASHGIRGHEHGQDRGSGQGRGSGQEQMQMQEQRLFTQNEAAIGSAVESAAESPLAHRDEPVPSTELPRREDRGPERGETLAPVAPNEGFNQNESVSRDEEINRDESAMRDQDKDRGFDH